MMLLCDIISLIGAVTLVVSVGLMSPEVWTFDSGDDWIASLFV